MGMTAGELLTLARATERRWVLNRSLPADRDRLPWMPADIAQWLVLLTDAMEAQHGQRYLEIGCGPGAKMLIARELFGLEPFGFDTDNSMIREAVRLLGPGYTETVDALGWPSYGDYDIIFFNRPFRDQNKEARLEKQVWLDARHGAAVICMNLLAPPQGWIPVADDWEARRGVWLKP